MRATLIIFLVFKYILVYSQTDSAFIKLTDRINLLYNTYEQMYPRFLDWDSYVSLYNYNLTKQEITKIKIDYDKQLSVYKDSITMPGLILAIQDFILQNVDSVFNNFNITNYDITNILKIPITVSKDNKLIQISLEAKTGGTYKGNITRYFYRKNDTTFISSKNSDAFEAFCIDGYNEIDTLNTDEGVKYLLLGSVMTCTVCLEEYIALMKYENNKFKIDFYYRIASRDWVNKIFVNDNNRTLKIEYNMEGLTSVCSCNNQQNKDSYYGDDYFPSDHKHCECSFRFNGITYELMDEKESDVKE